MIEINIDPLFGDFQEATHAHTVLRAQSMLYQATNGIGDGMLLQREYSGEIPLDKPTAALIASAKSDLDIKTNCRHGCP